MAATGGQCYLCDNLSHEHKHEPESQPEAPQPEQQEKISRQEYKQAMRQLFTIRLPQVVACGHKLDTKRDPKNNCDHCWFAFFNENADMFKTTEELLQKFGPEAIEQVRGVKYAKYFLRFRPTFVEVMERQAQEMNGEGSGSVDGGDRAGNDSSSGSGTGAGAGADSATETAVA